jgi:hypothetical protein
LPLPADLAPILLFHTSIAYVRDGDGVAAAYTSTLLMVHALQQRKSMRL